MAIWVCRTGLYGQHEKTFIDDSCICLTREGFNFDLSQCKKEDVVSRIQELNPDVAKQTISNTWSQINIFVEKMAVGDIVIIPKKKSHYINVARISGHYSYDETAVFPMNHRRAVEFLARDLDTTTFDQDIRYSLGTYRTVFGIKQEERFVAKLIKMGVSVNEI